MSSPNQLQGVRGKADRGATCRWQQSAHLRVRIATVTVLKREGSKTLNCER
jgi:hypothetical protein